MGGRHPPPPVQSPVRISHANMPTRLSIFPLTGTILLPGLRLPLHIFEPRYRALISDALARDRRIAMIQPQRAEDGAPLYTIGCVGKIGEFEALEDGRYNLTLEGESRFKFLRELDTATAFRQVEGELIEDDRDETLSHAQRGGFEREAREFASTQGYSVDWDSVERLDDQSLINSVSHIAPFDAASKQALLEARTLSERCELLVQLMQFFGRGDGTEEIMTLQ